MLMRGIHLRAVVGTIVVLADLGVFVANHVFLYSPFNKEELMMHGLMLVAGLMLIDREAAMQVLDKVKDKLPSFGSKNEPKA